MSDDKPKHKPQKKHTLSEVLKSLQDLIRTDLITAESTAHPSLEQPQDRPPPAATEPDSFNRALDQLDDMIQHNIIEPVERARETPPEPLLPEEVLEIEWENTPPAAGATESEHDLSFADEETIELQPKSAGDEGDAPVDVLDAAAEGAVDIEITEPPPDAEPPPGRDADDTNDVVPTDQPTIETIDLDSMPADEAPSEETVDLSSEPPAPPFDDDFVLTAPPDEESHSPQNPLFGAPLALTAAPAGDDTARAAPPLPDESSGAAQPQEPPEQDLPTLTVEYDIAGPPAALEDAEVPATEPPTAASGAEARPAATGMQPVAPETPSTPPEEPKPPKAQARPPDAPTPPDHALSAQARGVPIQEEIPILKEVAEVSVPAAPPLPDAGQARDIAIRVIAKLNIERRKAGEKPLDIKTIERLQQYLADALNKRALNKPK